MKISDADPPPLKADKRLTIRVDEHADLPLVKDMDFVESCVKQLEEGRPLSDKQRRWMEDLDERYVK